MIFVSSYFNDGVIIYAKNKAMIHLNSLVSQCINENIITTELDVISLDENNCMTIDTYQVNKIKSQAAKTLEKEFGTNKIDAVYMPIGYIFSNNIFLSYTPKMKINIEYTGSYSVEIDTEVSNIGINNSSVNVHLNIKMTFQLAIPLRSEEFVIESKIPIAIMLVQGDIPSLYYGNGLID